jgi:hypothetical protein
MGSGPSTLLACLDIFGLPADFCQRLLDQARVQDDRGREGQITHNSSVFPGS